MHLISPSVDCCEELKARFAWNEHCSGARKPLFNAHLVFDTGLLLRLAARVQRKQTVIVTFVSAEYCRLGEIWIRAARHIGAENFILICGDLPSFATFSRHMPGHAIHADTQGYLTENAYQSPVGFSQKGLAMTALKFPVIHRLLNGGFNVILSDIDAIWLKDPLPELTADIALQRVAYFPEPVVQLWGFAACSGFVWLRSNRGVISFVETCLEQQKCVQSDQLALNLALLACKTEWLRPDALEKDKSPPRSFDRQEIMSMFKAEARANIEGRMAIHGLCLNALPHHSFWRHLWVQATSSEVVICHPNSPKTEGEKVACYERLKLKSIRSLLRVN